MKKFFTMPLKGYNENVPNGFAKKLLVDESPFCKYLYDNKALAMKHVKRKAIMEFNNKNKYKISDIGELAEQLSILWSKWIFLGKRFKQIHLFNHIKFNMRVEDLLEKDYYKDY